MNASPRKPGDDWMKIVAEEGPQTFASAFTTDVRLDMSVAKGPISRSPRSRMRGFGCTAKQAWAFTATMSA
jgi:hypothetical protein